MLSEDLVDAVASSITELFPLLLERIPPAPAAQLGRLGAPKQSTGPHRRSTWGEPESPVLQGLNTLEPPVKERLRGALELVVGGCSPTIPNGLTLPGLPSGTRTVAMVSITSSSDLSQPVSRFDTLRPGTTALAWELAEVLVGHDVVRPLLAPDGLHGDEQAVAAGHGAAYLAFGVAIGTLVLRAQPPSNLDDLESAIIGTGLGIAARLLPSAPLPPAYAAAALEKRRAEYLLPRWASLTAPVTDHRFALVEGPYPETPDFTGNGLVEAVTGGVVVRSGRADGSVRASLRVLAEPPDEVDLIGWDEIVDLSWTAETGSATTTPGASEGTPPWPGTYRTRVQATGRDTEDESYQLTVWAAPAEPEVVHKRFDRLGHRLRGEPEPAVVELPEEAYYWIEASTLSVAATITVISRSTPEEVLRGFGADLDEPTPHAELAQDLSMPAWVAVTPIGDAVVAVENNGFRGTDQNVLRTLSAGTRAASMYWNVNGLTRLSFARDGEVLTSFEVGLQEPGDVPEVLGVLEGLDLKDYRHKIAKGLVAVERFSGHAVRREHIAAIEAADVGYPLSR